MDSPPERVRFGFVLMTFDAAPGRDVTSCDVVAPVMISLHQFYVEHQNPAGSPAGPGLGAGLCDATLRTGSGQRILDQRPEPQLCCFFWGFFSNINQTFIVQNFGSECDVSRYGPPHL